MSEPKRGGGRPRSPNVACGEYAAARRHERAGEVCETCAKVAREYRRVATARSRAKGAVA